MTITSSIQPMRVQVRPGSRAYNRHYSNWREYASGQLSRSALAFGIDPSPKNDLVYHGGKVVPHMEFQNVYLGDTGSWTGSDIDLIDRGITTAMQDKRLNNVMAQYFPGAKLSCDPRSSFIAGGSKPARIDEPGIKAFVMNLYDTGTIAKRDLGTTIFNLILPRGTVLRLDNDTSLSGLGGYHGSHHFTRAGKHLTLYYSANVYSEKLAGKRENGIAAFDQSWKNIVGTLYHEINEFRTDADVDDAIAKNDNDYLGWMSLGGEEVGDQPISAAGTDLRLVFKEVLAGRPARRVPVQFLYSNAVHGAEGPIAEPHL